MQDEARVELDWDAGKVLQAEFADRYQLRGSTSRTSGRRSSSRLRR